MIEVARRQKFALDETGALVAADPEQLAARAKLAQVIGEGVATSEQFAAKRKTPAATVEPPPLFRTASARDANAEAGARELAAKTSTVATLPQDAKKALPQDAKQIQG